jgi:hypothetical protein
MDMNNDDTPVVDGTIVEETDESGETHSDIEAIPTGGADAMVLTNLEQLIKTHIAGIDKGKEEAKKLKEMLDSMLANDSTYQEHDKLVKEAMKVKSGTRKQILSQQAAVATVKKLQEVKADTKEMQEALSDYLREYQRLSGSNEIEGEDGEVREIVYTAKLVKKSSQFRN